MKQKKIIVAVVIALISIASAGCSLLKASHEHSFGEWETKTSAVCEKPEIEVRRCECGVEETREGDPATGHSYTSITAMSKLEKPMDGMVVEVSDLDVTATCVCGEKVAITDGIELEGAILALGKNTVTVKYGELSTTLMMEAEKLDIVLDGTVTDDAYISSASKDKENSTKKEMGTKSDHYRIYFRTNIGEILNTELFAANKDNAKVQLILSITGGSVTDETTFTLKTYDPAVGATDVDFSKLTWNSVDNKDGSVGIYPQLHWSNGTELVSGGVGHNVSVDQGHIIVTLAYSQIADFVDKDGNIVFAFATNTGGLKIGSLENKTEANRPVITIVLNDEHFHVFDQKVAEKKYFVSANCKEKAKYYASCSCGATGTETFEHGGVIDHSYGELIPELSKTCTTDGVKAHYQCNRCGKYFLDKDGQMKLVKEEDLKISAGHSYGKLMEQKNATCTEDGMKARYKCDLCKKFFDENKVETTEEALKIQKLGHAYGGLIPEQSKTCTTDGVKAHYQCNRCGKYFLDKDGQMKLVKAEALKISAGHEYKLIPAQEATCTKDGNNKYYKCGNDGCNLYFDAEKKETTKEAQSIPALGHSYTSISAVSNLQNPMATMVVTTEDLSVTGTCGRCEESDIITEGIILENATLAQGENTVTVKYDELSTTVTIEAAEFSVTFDGTIIDDTYVDSSSKGEEYTQKTELNTNSSAYRTYFRINVKNILEDERFDEAQAKIQLILSITNGIVTDETTFTLKAYDPAVVETDVDFTKLTWNSVDNKDSSMGTYSQLHWNNGKGLVSGGVGYNVSVDGNKIIIKLAYSQIEEYVDANGNILFAFATNTSGLKVGSLENTTEANKPVFKVMINDEHFHVFDQEVTEDKYFVSANCGEKTKYYKSCSCGEAGTDIFEDGNKITHDMKTKWDEDGHWTKCEREGCDEQTKKVPHSGGTATETERAVCEVCGQPYGELKQPESTTVTVSGAIIDDTYVDSGNKNKDFSTSKTELNVRTKDSNIYRSYFRFDFSNVLNAEGFNEYKSNATVQFTFAVTAESINETTTFSFYTFDVKDDTAISNVAFKDINWNSVKDGAYNKLGFNSNSAVKLVDGKTISDDGITYENKVITITVNYSDIEQYMDENNRCLFGLTTSSTDLKIASMENESYAHPAVSVTFTKGGTP